MRGWTDDQAAAAGAADGRAWALRTMLHDPGALKDYASGPSARREILMKISTRMHMVARSDMRRFGARDDRRREEKVGLYVESYVLGAAAELDEEAERRRIG
jgi:hypothetical protein